MLYLCIHMTSTTELLFSQLNQWLSIHLSSSDFPLQTQTVRLLYWRADVVAGLLGVGEGAVASRWDAVTFHEGLGKAFARLQLSSFGRRAKAGDASRCQVVHNTWRGRPRWEWKNMWKSTHTMDRQRVNVHIPAARGTSGPTTTSPTWWSLQNWARIAWLLINTSEWRQTLTRVTGQKVCIC